MLKTISIIIIVIVTSIVFIVISKKERQDLESHHDVYDYEDKDENID